MTLVTNAQVDPTRTVTLRNEYAKALRKRFVALKTLVTETVITNDALGLGDRKLSLRTQARAARRYDFPSDPAGKARAFMDWLMQAVDDGILEVTQREGRRIALREEWQNLYVRAAYARGIEGANDAIRRGGVVVPENQVWGAFYQPARANTLAMLFTRNFSELQGITEAMGQAIARELAMGMAKGLGPQAIARLINAQVDGIGIRRAILLARTEVIRAHAESTLDRYSELGIEGVVGQVEFRHANAGVCNACKDLGGHIYTIANARGVIPVHPQCRCAWLPVIKSV